MLEQTPDFRAGAVTATFRHEKAESGLVPYQDATTGAPLAWGLAPIFQGWTSPRRIA